jgi:hypothetical protein
MRDAVFTLCRQGAGGQPLTQPRARESRRIARARAQLPRCAHNGRRAARARAARRAHRAEEAEGGLLAAHHAADRGARVHAHADAQRLPQDDNLRRRGVHGRRERHQLVRVVLARRLQVAHGQVGVAHRLNFVNVRGAEGWRLDQRVEAVVQRVQHVADRARRAARRDGAKTDNVAEQNRDLFKGAGE